jgi:hypothetical protein
MMDLHEPTHLEWKYLEWLLDGPVLEKLPPRKATRLKIIHALYSKPAATQKDIADAFESTPTTVSKIKKEITEQGFFPVIEQAIPQERLEQMQKDSAPTLAGRPQLALPEEWVRLLNVDSEPIFQWSTLRVAPETVVTSFSIRRGRATFKQKPETIQTHLQQLHREFDDAKDRSACWTDFLFQDKALRKIFAFYRDRGRWPPIQSKDPEFPPLSERFDERYGHLIFYSGNMELGKAMAQQWARGCKGRVRLVPVERELFPNLENWVFYQRTRRSCPGFMPTFESLSFIPLRCHQLYAVGVMPLDLATCGAETEQATRARCLMQRYFAMSGVLWGLRPTLWNSLAHNEEVSLGDLLLEPKSYFARIEETGRIEATVRMLPALGYSGLMPEGKSLEECEAYASSLRLSPKVIYSSRIAPVSCPYLPINWFTADSDQNDASAGWPVVLLPRHMLTPEPDAPPTDYASYTSENGQARERNGFDGISIDCPDLEHEIRSAFKNGNYVQLLKNILKLRDSIGVLGPQGKVDAEQQERAINEKFDRPPFNELNARFMGGVQKGGGFIFGVRAFHPAIEIDDIAGNLNSAEDYLKFLTQVDADFLLMGINPEVRQQIEEVVRQEYSERLANIIYSRFWGEDGVNAGFIENLLTESTRQRLRKDYGIETGQGMAGPLKDLGEDLCNDTLAKFSGNPRYPIRVMIENMQRCAVEVLTPIPVFFQDQRVIVKRWESYLRKALNGHIQNTLTRRAREQRIEDWDTIEQSEDLEAYDGLM